MFASHVGLNQGGEIIDGVAYTQEEASDMGDQKGYRNAETLMAEIAINF